MSIQSAIRTTLPALQMEAESLMQDTLAAYSPNGTTEDADGMEVPNYETEGLTRGKIAGTSRQGGDTNARTVSVGGVDRLVVEGGLHIPVDSPEPAWGGVGVGWEYVLTSPGPLTPASLKDSRWLVVDAPAKSFMTARRLDVVRLS